MFARAPFAFLVILELAASAVAQSTWHVAVETCTAPGSGSEVDPFCSIQAAIDAADNGDLVLVGPGVYAEHLSLVGIGLQVRSTHGPFVTTLAPAVGSVGSLVEIINGTPPFVTLDGFSLIGSDVTAAALPVGGGVFVSHSDCSITNCIFDGNRAFRGGGLFNFGGFPVVTNCIFMDNFATDGGGVYDDHGFVDMVNCTLVGNDASANGGGMFSVSASIVTNCVFWNNSDSGGADESAQLWIPGGSGLFMSFSCLQGLDLFAGNGNIGFDPLFANEALRDFRLSAGSPCIDAGQNASVAVATDITGRPRRMDDPFTDDTGSGPPPVVDMGPHEFGDDCNGNGVPDGLDIINGTSSDCDRNGVPDECQPDCNDNGAADPCDIAAGTSEDCSGNGVPDECEPDCNSNGAADSCDVAGGASEDCNANAAPDECDIADGGSDDVNGNGVPDECEHPFVAAEGSRYFFVLPAATNELVALHITSDDLPCLAAYAGADGRIVEAPVFLTVAEWASLDVHVHGAEIIPNTTYQVRSEFPTGALSAPSSATTWLWGDVDNNGVTNLGDVALIVQGLQGNFTNITMQRADLDGCDPNGVINIADALRAVQAFQGIAYSASCPTPCAIRP